MNEKNENRAGRPGSKETKKLKIPYLDYTQMDKNILRKIEAGHCSHFLSCLAGRIANRLEKEVTI